MLRSVITQIIVKYQISVYASIRISLLYQIITFSKHELKLTFSRNKKSTRVGFF